MRPPDDDGFACFELLGYDILLDHKCRPWLLEVNHSPSFCTDSVLDLQVKQHLILDTLALVRGSAGFHSFVFHSSSMLCAGWFSTGHPGSAGDLVWDGILAGSSLAGARACGVTSDSRTSDRCCTEQCLRAQQPAVASHAGQEGLPADRPDRPDSEGSWLAHTCR